MNDFEKLVLKLANTLLSAPIGRTMNEHHPEEERIDMPLHYFRELRLLSNAVLEQIKIGESK